MKAISSRRYRMYGFNHVNDQWQIIRQIINLNSRAAVASTLILFFINYYREILFMAAIKSRKKYLSSIMRNSLSAKHLTEVK